MKSIRILAVNLGSSSLRYAFFKNNNKIFSGKVGAIKNPKNEKLVIKKIIKEMRNNNFKPDIIGHRIVHGFDESKTQTVTKSLLKKLEKIECLAPVHIKNEISLIKKFEKLKIKQAVVFDTEFHSTMPEKATIYAIPNKFYGQGIKRYGFHGLAYKHILGKLKDKKHEKIIMCHLGNGSSVCAVKNGKSVDTSMGLTPLEGIVMATRSGSIDPSIIFFLNKKGHPIKEIEKMLNKKSGLLGISGKDHHLGRLLKRKDKMSKLAVEAFCYSAAKQIGAYAAALNGCDAIAFSGGIGKNNSEIRARILEHFGFLGLKLDEEKNNNNQEIISSDDSKIKVYAFEADEEQVIAEEVLKLAN